MQLRKYLSLTIVFLNFYIYGADNREILYSLAFLKNYKAVRTYLQKVGFQKVRFKTSDNLTLKGLFLLRSNARYTVILCSGWRPGRKEGMATFYDILPNDCNILLFDPRGRGQSEGSFFGKIWEYGIHEYKDIAAAITWVNKNNTLPIFIIGICAGAFNAIHTLFHLTKTNQLLESHVKGIIFDSGWGSVIHISESAAFANIEEIFIFIFAYFYKNKESIRESFIFKLSNSCAYYLYKTIHFLLAQPIIRQYESITSLFNKIDRLIIPIFFIHSYNDQHAHITKVMKLCKLTPLKKSWWIKKSYHTRHHILHRDTYKEKLRAFIDNVLSQ